MADLGKTAGKGAEQMYKHFDGFKVFHAWSEAHAIQQLCAWLEKRGEDISAYDWGLLADTMFKEYLYSSSGKEKGDGTWWVEEGKGIYAHGDTGGDGYRFRLELHDVEPSDQKYKVKVTFYVSIADGETLKKERTKRQRVG